MSKPTVLFQLSGSIAAYKACQVISRLVQEGHEVRTACSQAAKQFIGPATLEGLTGHPPFVDSFESGRGMDHISLADWADIAVLCPASANKINQLAGGIASDAIGTLFLAWDLKKPYLVAPAMNTKMLNHPATQKSLGILESWKVGVLPTDQGALACGEYGDGRLLDPDRIYDHIVKCK